MFTVNDDNSIYVTRGDIVALSVAAKDDSGEAHKFQPGDVLRLKVFAKKDCESVVLQKDFPITSVTVKVEICLDENETKIGGVISKPTDYWYEVELNPHSDPQTIIGYGEDGPAVFRLFPEGRDLEEYEYTEEDIPFVDDVLDLTSPRPVQNQAVARAFANLQAGYDATNAAVADIHITPQMLGGVADGETEIGDVLRDYINSTNAERINIYFPPGEYRWNLTVETDKTIMLRGKRGQSVIINDGDVACLKHYGNCTIDGLKFKVSSASRTEYTVYAVGGSEMRCYDTVFESSSSAINGLHIEDVILSHIDRCTFNNSRISLKTWDCKITNTWAWAIWQPYAIGIHGGCGNINLSNVDIVPPLRTESGAVRDGIKSAIWVNSEGGSETNNVIMENIFLDGNPNLDTGIGVLCENVFCITISSFRATRMSECPIIIDGCYDVVVSKGMFYNNNKTNLGVNEILVRHTVGNKHGSITIADNHFVNYKTTITASAPAIKVADGADTSVAIVRNMVGQHSGLQAYGEITIQTPSMSDLHTNIVTGSAYKTSGSFVITSGATGASLTLPRIMAKRPTQGNFRFWVTNGYLPSLRVQENNSSNVWVGIATAPSSDLTVYYEVTI